VDCNATCDEGKCISSTLNCDTLDLKCDYTRGVCYQCNSTGDCPKNKPVCSNNVCIECNTGDECPGEKPVCSDMKCVQCRTMDDCEVDNNACDIQCTQGLCEYSGLNCTKYDSECATSTQCSQCRISSDCKIPSAPACDTTIGVCVRCTEDVDCNSPGQTCGAKCVQNACTGGSTNCSTPTTTPTAPIPPPTNCTTDPDCRPGDTSCGAKCVLGSCSAGIDCTVTNTYCLTTSCVQCLQDVQCPGIVAGCENNGCVVSFRTGWKVFVPTGAGILIVIAVFAVLLVRYILKSRRQNKYGAYALLANPAAAGAGAVTDEDVSRSETH